MSTFKLKPTHRGCENLFALADDYIEKVECFPYGRLVRLYLKTGQEVDIFPTEDEEGKYSIAIWKSENRTVLFEKVCGDDLYSLKRYLDRT